VVKREVEYLGRRAFDFLETTWDDVEKSRFDLAAFHAEQTLQLALKYLLARDFGHYPHTHDLRDLFELLKEKRPEVWDFYLANRYAVEILVDAYVGARYLPRSYKADVVKHLVEVAARFLEEYVGVGREEG